MDELDARDHLPRHLRPSREALASAGHHPLITTSGPLDVLGSIGEDDDYPALLHNSERVQIDRDVSVRILDLETLIEVKEKTARAKDRYMLEILRAMKENASE